MLPEGTHRARGKTAQPHTNKNGKDLIRVVFEIDGDEYAFLWFMATDANTRRTLGDLQKCGCDVGRGNLRTALEGFGSREVELVIEHQPGNDGKLWPKVKYVNVPGEAPSGGALPTLTDAEARAMDARWRHIMQEFSLLKPTSKGEDVPF